MNKKVALICALPMVAAGLAQAAPPNAVPNEIVGTWCMVTARLEEEGRTTLPYGPRPAGMLVFTADMRFVEVLTNADTPRFASNTRGAGTDAENRAAMGSGIGFFGTYTIDAAGHFSGNRVAGSTFPNWVGSERTTDDLKMIVRGDRMFETFHRPGGGVLRAEFRRQTSSSGSSAC